MGPKKGGKTDKKKLKKLKEEQKRLEEEAERKLKEQEEHARLEKEEHAREEKIATEALEQMLRVIQITNTYRLIQRNTLSLSSILKEKIQLSRWNEYLVCDGLPNPTILPEINNYLTIWKEYITQQDFNEVVDKTDEVLYLMNKLQLLIEHPEIGVDTRMLEQMDTVYNEMRLTQAMKLDTSTYALLQNINDLMEAEAMILKYFQKSKHITMGIWSNVTRNINQKVCHFEELGFTFELPASLLCSNSVIRVMHVTYDHFSHMSCSYYPPPFLEDRNIDFLDYVGQQWAAGRLMDDEVDVNPNPPEEAAPVAEAEDVMDPNVLNAQDKHKRRRSSANRRGSKLSRASKGNRKKSQAVTSAPPVAEMKEEEPVDPSLAKILMMLETPPKTPEEKSSSIDHRQSTTSKSRAGKKGKPKASNPLSTLEEFVNMPIDEEKERERIARETLTYPCEKGELNLRQYAVIGGVIHFDLLALPPQPLPVPHWSLSELEESQTLNHVPFVADYKPPLTADQQQQAGAKKEPEEIERELKAQEEELLKLIVLSIKVPQTAIWFEPPVIALWEPSVEQWITSCFWDHKYNEETMILTVRTSKFGTIALAQSRFLNMPFQSWDLKPGAEANTVVLNIIAAVVGIEFTVKDDLVCVSDLQNGVQDMLSHVIGKFMELPELIKLLRQSGLDLFPEHDSYCYVEGINIKHTPTEEHVYRCMALCALVMHFCSSRWNLFAGPKKMVMQCREEVGRNIPVNYNMVVVTPKRASVINCTEVSPAYVEVPLGHIPFQADLYNLLFELAEPVARQIIQSTNNDFTDTVCKLLTATKLFSFS